jgi:TonB-dependent receptor
MKSFMRLTLFRRLFYVVIIMIASANIIYGISTSRLSGSVKNASTGEVLFGANVILKGTGMGSSTDMDGMYNISNIPPGSYTILVTYIGYKSQSHEIIIKENERITRDFGLESVALEGEQVVVTAQATGQTQAINQQLSSNQIINVVSAAKIQELPDANAAESVGRLPGISVLRSGGEGNAVVIRGLQPKYNKILIDGVQMSSSNPEDRGSDLSTISSNMLEGIQVSKSLTADMDADVIGGTVDFNLREAKYNESEIPLISALAQGSYNNLSNTYNKYNNYKYVLSGENRYLDKQLGIFIQLDVERKNLTSNELGATYTHAGASTIDYYTTSLGLYYIPRDRQRYNGALVMDYKLPDGKMKFSNFFSSGTTKSLSRYENLDVLNNQHLFQLSSSKSTLNIITNSLGLEQQVNIFQLNAKLSHTYSEVKNPGDWTVNFLQTDAGFGPFNNVADVNPEDIPKAANNNFEQALINGIVTGNSFSKEQAITASLDLKTNFNFSNYISADLKIGGKFRYQSRLYTNDLFNGGGLQFGDAQYVNDLIINHFNLPVPRYHISLPYFNDPKFSYGKYLDGKYNMVGPLDFGKMYELINLIKTHTQDIADYPGAGQSYGHNNYESESHNYSGIERQSAFYAMSVINFGPAITFIPGVRYQNLQTSYKGTRGIQNKLSYLSYVHYDTTVTQNHGYWLPNFSLRIKPFSWFDVRLSYTKSLSYPDFIAVIPRIDVAPGNSISWNNFSLVPQRSTNYDLYLSFYENTIGLFTIGGFLKQINDLIYGWQFYKSGVNALPYFPPGLITSSTKPSGVYAINTYVNNPKRVDDYGIEVDWQTHFWYLPGPLSGLVFSINYTHIYSKAEYPFTNIKTVGRKTVYVDTTFTDRLLDQPDDILNVSLGFDYLDFSVRVSMLYQTDIFTGVNFWPQLRSHTSAYRRWDLAAKQKLPWYGLEVFCNINNINGASDNSVIQGGGGVPLSEQQYGLTADLGLQIEF